MSRSMLPENAESQSLYTSIVIATLLSIFAFLSATARAQAEGWFGSPPSPPAETLATLQPNIFVDLSKKVVPSVVNISTKSRPKRQQQMMPFGGNLDPFFGFPFGQGGQGMMDRSPEPVLHSLGSGVVIDRSEGSVLILTNFHVVDEADEVQVQFQDHTEAPKAEIAGLDRDLDLALLKVSVKDVPDSTRPLPLGDSDALQVGEFVMAVGNPFGQGHSVSHGIISAKGRDTPMILGRYLQTDAPINPGNSGGPLLNLKGEIIGINDAILAQAQGIGFAIPSNDIKKVLPQLKTSGKVSRGYIGIQLGSVSEEAATFNDRGLTPGQPFVAGIERGGPADKAGLQPKDVIKKFNKKDVHNVHELLMEVTSVPPGQKVPVEVLRQGRIVSLNVQVTERPTG